jgi:hypothetical protein
MLYAKQTYKKVFSSLILIAYLIGNFSIPLIEGLHFLTHLNDANIQGYHSFQSHTEQHQHLFLAFINDWQEDDTQHPPAPADKKIKKLVQINYNAPTLSTKQELNNSKSNYYKQLSNQFYTTIQPHPPQV